MSTSQYIPKKIDLKPKRYHFYNVLLFILGTVFPPLAVAARFGIGGDFWLNLVLTICGYIPGHGHNFYIQNIRNNKNHRRTPKWAQRYGLVDTSEIKRKERKSQWANRYSERNPHSTLSDQAYEEGQVAAVTPDQYTGDQRRQAARSNGEDGLWNPTEEQFYNAENDSSSSRNAGRWHYPINADDAIPASPNTGRKKKDKKDRWARTEDAYASRDDSTRKRKKKSSRRTDDSERSRQSSVSGTNFPEDPEGGLYGSARRPSPVRDDTIPPAAGGRGRSDGDELNHQF